MDIETLTYFLGRYGVLLSILVMGISGQLMYFKTRNLAGLVLGISGIGSTVCQALLVFFPQFSWKLDESGNVISSEGPSVMHLALANGSAILIMVMALSVISICRNITRNMKNT